MKKRLLAVLLTVVMVLAMLPTTALAADKEFELEKNEYSGDVVLKKYNGPGGAVTIPNSVTSIGYQAFSGCTGLTSVTIPNSVTSIGWNAFFGCTGLTSVTIPNSVTSIGGYTFSGCTGLTSVTIPNSVTSIESSAFSDCTGLTSVTIPDSVTSIGERAFSGCTGLTSVSIPNSVTSIGGYTFSGCTGLTSVTIPAGVTSIERSAFWGCTDLTSVTIPAGVTKLDPTAFTYCENLESIQVDPGNRAYTSVDGVAFNLDGSILVACPAGKRGEYTIPEGVISIGQFAFDGCNKLLSLVISDGVTRIEQNAFWRCDALVSVVIPTSVTRIEEYAFGSYYNTKNVYYAGTEEQWKTIRIEEGNESLTSANIHYNSTGPTLPTVEPIPATGTAYARTKTVKLDGWDQEFQCYAVKDAKGNETNYVKIRDLAYALNGTKAHFNVGWDGKISIISGAYYDYTGGEGTTPYSGDQPYTSVSSTPVSFNGTSVNLTSFLIKDSAGNGYTYYKLRDLGQLLGFNVKWDSSAKSVVIETGRPFTGQ